MRKRRKENMNQEIETVDEESPLNAWEVNTTGKFAEHFFSVVFLSDQLKTSYIKTA